MELAATTGFRVADAPSGPVEYLVTGSAEPVTLLVHGLAGSAAQTRPFGSGLAGTKVLPHLRGHGATPVPDAGPGGYADLAAEVEAVRAASGATAALGVSLGAGALLRGLVDAALAGRTPPWHRVALVVPPAVRPDGAGDRGPLLALADALEARDPAAAAAALRDQQPVAVRRLPAVALWARRRAAELAGPVLPPVLRAFAAAGPLDGLGAGGPDGDPDGAVDVPGLLGRVDVPVLVVGQDGDDVHPLAAARALAAALPRAELVVLPPGGVLWSGRDRLRDVLTGFFGASG